MCYDYTGKIAPWRAKFREPRSTTLYPNPRYNEGRYKEGRLYHHNIILSRSCFVWIIGGII